MKRQNYAKRKYIIISIILIVGIIYIIQLFYIQIVDKKYQLSAYNNVLRNVTQYPARGLIYDRNGKLLVYNEAAYDLMVIPKQVKDLDTNELCNLINIDKKLFIKKIKKARQYSIYKPSILEKQISKETDAYLEEELYKFPGFFVQTRTLRKYPVPIAAHTLGYVGEVNPDIIKNNPYYKLGDYIGISGIEKTYEKELRGKKGKKIIVVDVFNRGKGSYKNGKYDIAAIAGKSLHISLDADLQAYGEKLMRNKKGSIVAIEPSSGEILALVSSPSYDPNLLVGRVRTKNYNKLIHDTLKPLINRPLTGLYPPGSVFKLINALIALQEKVLTPETYYSCHGPESYPLKCHYHISPLNLKQAIEVSCNSYFWNVFKSIIENPDYESERDAFKAWHQYVVSFGLAQGLKSHLYTERNGSIPSAEQFDDIYGKGHWNALTIRSLAIGQGEILVTPLQLANLSATIANRGFYYTPHIIKAIGKKNNHNVNYKLKHYTKIDPKYFDIIVDGMYQVFEGKQGTARWYKINGIPICGKTGTSENPHGKDHSIFIAFAPKDNPKIAVSVIIENSGFGATWAAPITTLMIEKYLNGFVKRKNVEKRIMNSNLISEN